MANNSRVSRSASIEDLREKNVQMKAEMSKLAEDVREVMRKQEESTKRQEESQKRLEESNRILDDKLSNLGIMMERTIRQISGKGNSLQYAEASNSNGRKANGDGVSRSHLGGFEERNVEEGMNPNYDMNSEEYNWTETQLRRERGVRSDNRKNMQMPKMDFSQFNGSETKVWKAKCEHYFEIYEVPDMYKSRMALINFSEDVYEWYNCLVSGGRTLPWEVLAEEVLARYQDSSTKDLVDEFKRVHQVGRVEEYIKRFDKSRARLLIEKPTLDEAFFVSGFISGLKEEIRYLVEMFNPRTLNSVYKCALKAEATYEAQSKKSKDSTKGYKFQKYPSIRPRTELDKQARR